ncbi:unnamed protein product [Clavelina lepadiformis]|uniref:Centrosomal protein CCDC61 n=2 Tax=Clavelina lepadiformis TaxID=159417 RepID=A0ABP0FMZ4_CLALP
MDTPYHISGEYVFRGIEYVVTFRTLKSNLCLTIEVEDKVTGDQWKGNFESGYIEELTHKTGNFKQFDVFISMLESALNKTTDSVALDLLTFADLELLRNRKALSGGQRVGSKPRQTTRQQENKRYLILVYSVEFDRIHYPLPLPYVGKPDPAHLQNLVRQLNDEITKLKSGRNNISHDKGFQRLKEDYETVLQEKNELEHAFQDLKLQGGNKLVVTKEVRILKKVVQNLELEMMKEKNKYQRQISKKTAEIKRLTSELSELSSRERTLQIRVKSLTNELAMYKRSRTPMNTSMIPSSGDRNLRSRNSVLRPQSGARPSSGHRRSASRGSQSASFYRPRSSSKDRPPSLTRDRSSSRDKKSNISRNSHKSRTPTPNRFARFDPTLYNEEKKRKLQESQERLKRRSSAGFVPISNDLRGRSRTRLPTNRYTSGLRNRNGSVESRNSSDNGSMTRLKSRRTPTWQESPVYVSNRRHRFSSTPDVERRPPGGRAGRKKRTVTNDADIDEIDARLEALQQYMQEIEKK